MNVTSSAGDLRSVLVVDDDPGMQSMIAEFFRRSDIRVQTGNGLQDINRHLATGEVSLIILDLRLGRENGLDVLRELRTRSAVPVIIMTGHRRDEVDRVLGLELGADDYVTKPFGLHELLARARAVMRRAGPPDRGKDRHSSFAGWRLDRKNRRLTDPTGHDVPLTKGDYGLLCAFLDAPQMPLTREQLLAATRMHEDVFDRSIDVQILRLRRKLEQDPSLPQLIRTERGVGYTFATPVQSF